MENNNLEKKSVLDIIKALEEKTLNPKELGKDTLKECVRFMSSHGYPGLEMGQILQMTPRNVLRYLKKIRKENSLVMSVDYQREFLGEIINNFRTQYSRLIRISYSDDLTNYEKIRAIFAACQIGKAAVEIMERLGYLNKQELEEAEKESNMSQDNDPLISIADKLLPEQREKLLEFIKSDAGYAEEKLLKMARLFIAENKHLCLYDADGNLKTEEFLDKCHSIA